MNSFLQPYLPQIIALCESHHVEQLYAIGSVLTDKFRKDSDVDLLVTFGKIDLLQYADNYFDLQEKLEVLLRRRVDLVIEKDLKNKALIKEINRTKVKTYERPRPEMAV
jgi:predicted nucleotidyltransferase